MAEARYVCSICGLHYGGAGLAGRCHAWCSTHSSCNLGIARQSYEAMERRGAPEKRLWDEYPRKYALASYRFDGNREDYLVGRLIFRHMRGRRVLDMGCGPVEPIFAVFYPEAREVVAVDALRANLDFARKNARELAPIIGRARAYRLGHLSGRENSPKIRYVRGDVTKRLGLGKFDSVMQIGCFGCLASAAEFQAAVDNAYACLKKGGTLLMVNWLEGKHTSALDCSRLYAPSLKKAGFRGGRMHGMSSGLNDYSRREGFTRIIWAVAKKPA